MKMDENVEIINYELILDGRTLPNHPDVSMRDNPMTITFKPNPNNHYSGFRFENEEGNRIGFITCHELTNPKEG